MRHLLVVGGASLDTLHLADRTAVSAGGAGMYTAMAAQRCGVKVSMFGPQPAPLHDQLKPVAKRLHRWLGPQVDLEHFPRFEISYLDGETRYLQVNLDLETTLKPEMLPADLSVYDLVHLIPLGDATRQLTFLRSCRQRGARQISAGTGMFIAKDQAPVVHQIAAESDIFFMNDSEAAWIFGPGSSVHTTPGQVLYVTSGAKKVDVVCGDTVTSIPVLPVEEVDPTGAGDTFCGATLAFLMQNEHPVMAARKATPLAAEMIGQIGPAALLADQPPPPPFLDPRVQVNERQVAKVAKMVGALSEVIPFSFTGPTFPREGHPTALDYFFSVALQQFQFWLAKDNHYDRPLYATLGDAYLKGSDYAFVAYTRKLEREPEFFTPERQANLKREELWDLFEADDGSMPMPVFDQHLELARRYGRDMLALRLTPQLILEESLASAEPLQHFIAILDKISGYREDPLRKKSTLLAMILNQRPEKFFPLSPETQLAPVIDYHLMRSCLRIGLVDVLDNRLRDRFARREIVSPAEEWAVRFAAYQAIEKLVVQSGKSTGAVDYYFFGARKRCPEMTEPECRLCQVDPVCAHRKELFQPVIHTTFY